MLIDVHSEIVPSKNIDSSVKQPEKAYSLIIVIEFGIVIEVSDVQLWKAVLPIEVTESGMVIEERDSQPKKVCPSIEVTESGMVIEVSEVQL